MTCPRDHIVLLLILAASTVGCDKPRQTNAVSQPQARLDSIKTVPLRPTIPFLAFVQTLSSVNTPFQVTSDYTVLSGQVPLDSAWTRIILGDEFGSSTIVGKLYTDNRFVTLMTHRIGDINVNSLTTFTADGRPIDTFNLVGEWHWEPEGEANFAVTVARNREITVSDTVVSWRKGEKGERTPGTVKTRITTTHYVLGREGRFRKVSVLESKPRSK